MDAHDVIVIGGGHAGAEAAWAASHLGARTALITMNAEAIGRMSCNPAIGGIGKGQMVREIDALGGLMGLAIDATGIQFRMLNRSKGPAVWSPRAQADRDDYPAQVQRLLQQCSNLSIVEGVVQELLTSGLSGGRRQVRGVRLRDGRQLTAPAVVITTGTFLRGLMHCGEQQSEGGRVGEPAAPGLSAALVELGFTLGRLKTGTPPRVHRDSINYEVLEAQPGDDAPYPFSFMTECIDRPQVDCWITFTTPSAHEVIRANLHRAPMYSGQITATGVRYCPSIEDKVVRFADKPRHQVFLEPEGYRSDWVYCNGLGTSLPRDVQQAVVQGISGLEQARIVQWGYAVEYDFVPTHQIHYSLETKKVGGLFLAGQINGTSGYEEAAGQGVIAGINAVRMLQRSEPLVLRRDQAYIGVMIDDLIARPPDEPYRMFTSRAEYRLMLRADNADERLTPIGHRLGLVGKARWQRYQRKTEQISQLEELLAGTHHEGKSLLHRLRGGGMDWEEAVGARAPACRDAPRDVREQVMVRAKYSGYLERMKRDVQRLQRLEHCNIPERIDFEALSTLRFEAREKLTAVRPRTLGQASRISGITPADITVLWIAIEADRRRSASAGGAPSVKRRAPA